MTEQIKNQLNYLDTIDNSYLKKSIDGTLSLDDERMWNIKRRITLQNLELLG